MKTYVIERNFLNILVSASKTWTNRSGTRRICAKLKKADQLLLVCCSAKFILFKNVCLSTQFLVFRLRPI